MRPVRDLWADLRGSLWFLPATFVAAAVLIALALIEVDAGVGLDAAERWPRLFGVGADGSRGVLTAVASSMITVAGVTFSITIVALSLASSQYTSRVLRNFMSDRANQAVLGVFLGIFVYCLVVLRTIRGGDEGAFVPSFAVFFGVILAFVGIGFLIHFIHHIASSIQASYILEMISLETVAAIDRIFPDSLGAAESKAEASHGPLGGEWTTLHAARTGYVQRVNADALLAFALDCNVVVRMERSIGDFAVEGTPLASISVVSGANGTGAGAEEATGRVNAAYTLNRQRTVDQDPAYGIRQTVDIALKALSPAVNDTTTAVMCIHYLSAILVRLADRRILAPSRRKNEVLRVLAHGPGFAEFVAEAFDQIRQNADGNVAVLEHLLSALRRLGTVTIDSARRQVLVAQCELTMEVSRRTIPAIGERERLDSFGAQVLRELREGNS